LAERINKYTMYDIYEINDKHNHIETFIIYAFIIIIIIIFYFLLNSSIKYADEN